MSVVRFGLELAKALLCILFDFFFLISCEIPDKNLHIVYLVLKIFLVCFFSTKKCRKKKRRWDFMKLWKIEEKGFMELNKTVYLDGYVYETTLLFCETLKFSKAADLKKIINGITYVGFI